MRRDIKIFVLNRKPNGQEDELRSHEDALGMKQYCEKQLPESQKVQQKN